MVFKLSKHQLSESLSILSSICAGLSAASEIGAVAAAGQAGAKKQGVGDIL